MALLPARIKLAYGYLFATGRVYCFSTMGTTKLNENSAEDEIVKKLIYSSNLFKTTNRNKKQQLNKLAKERLALKKYETEPIQSISLKLLTDSSNHSVETQIDYVNPAEPAVPVMPMGLKVVPANVIKDDVCSQEDQLQCENDRLNNNFQQMVSDGSTVTLKRTWPNDYVQITHSLENKDVDSEWTFEYGTTNPEIPISKVPCGGCGAMLHCQNSSIPGFVPQELFTNCKDNDLRSLMCQRCYFIQNHDTALAAAVDKQVYPKIISHIKNKKALVLLAIDVLDFPCSIWPGITDLVGLNCPLFLIGNKIDLLTGDGPGWMTNVEKSIRSCLPRKANVIGIQLVSAKTGFGVEELISKLQNIWQYQGDVYLVGCVNVGKSTLFNALLQSDYCKVKAADLVQRATISPWPGTTMNLLKFPILRPEGWRLYLRSQRLKMDKTGAMEAKLRHESNNKNSSSNTAPQLIGHIGRTFHKKVFSEEDAFSVPEYSKSKEPIPGGGLNPKDPEFSSGRWFYDSPGVLHGDQILDLLTTDELMKVLPQKIVQPRTFMMKPGWVMLIGGLARLDYLQGVQVTRWSVFVSQDLPITICNINDAEDVYNQLLGSQILSVPIGDKDRLKKWPALQHKNVFKFSGISEMESCGDIVLSSCGWVSFTAEKKQIISIRPWTPEGRGIFTRSPALLPFSVNLRGSLIRHTPAYSRSKPFNKSKR